MLKNIHFLLHPTPCVVVELPENCFEKCEVFATDVYETNKDCYQGRRQTSKNEIIRQIITGKLGEFAVYYYMNAFLGFHSNDVDLEIYKTKEVKSFDADFRAGKIGDNDAIYNIHVKSILCSSAKKYGLSWIMEKNDPLFNNMNKMDEVFAFCQVLGKRIVHFYGFLPLPMLRLGKPKKSSLKSKYAIYFGEQMKDQIIYGLDLKK